MNDQDIKRVLRDNEVIAKKLNSTFVPIHKTEKMCTVPLLRLFFVGELITESV